MYDFYLKFCAIIWRENNNSGSCPCIVAVPLSVSLVSANSPWNMASNTGLLIDSTNMWAGITCLLSLSPFILRTTNLISLRRSLLKKNLVLSLMVGLVICQFSSPTDMASVVRWAVNQGKIYLSAVSIRFINRVETETVVFLEIWR